MNDFENEFSRVIPIEKIKKIGHWKDQIKATADERKKLAERMKVQEIQACEADVNIDYENKYDKNILTITGNVKATIIQNCVITDDPVSQEMIEPIHIIYQISPKEEHMKQNFVNVDAFEDIEPYYENNLDIGEEVAQILALNIDPYPKKKGALLEF